MRWTVAANHVYFIRGVGSAGVRFGPYLILPVGRVVVFCSDYESAEANYSSHNNKGSV